MCEKIVFIEGFKLPGSVIKKLARNASFLTNEFDISVVSLESLSDYNFLGVKLVLVDPMIPLNTSHIVKCS